LIRLDKPVGSFLLLWPALTALLCAFVGRPPALVVFVFICGVFVSRSAGCILNDIADRKLDKHVERTRNRPITSGRVSVIEALSLCALLLLIDLGLVLLLNKWCLVIAVVAVLMMAVYPFLKRVTHLPQVWLGLVFNLGVLMAYAAAGKSLGLSAWLLYFATVLFTVAYDTYYGMSDRQDDLRVGIKSTAILFGVYDRLVIALLQLVAFVLLVLLGALLARNIWFFFGLLLALGFAAYQQALTSGRESAGCFRAFLNNNYLLASIFLGVLLSYL
jgi:4-hydroxybenzoate polyprenyltransferase